jgi:hypothetical protein
MRMIVIILIIITYIIAINSYHHHHHHNIVLNKKNRMNRLRIYDITSRNEFNKLPDWAKRDNEEEVIYKEGDNNVITNAQLNGEVSLFDSLYDIDDSNAEGTAASLTLSDISESSCFSLSFLGDFLVQMGCKPPIDINAKLGNLLTGEQIFTLLQAINTLDPFDSNLEYDSVPVDELAEELGVSTNRILKILESKNINLPFGLDTVLHSSIIDSVKNSVDDDEFPDTEYIDVEEE